MTQIVYLVHFDVLGFENRPRNVADMARVHPEEVRAVYLRVLEQRVETLRQQGKVLCVDSGDDDWTITVDSLPHLFQSICHILYPSMEDTGKRSLGIPLLFSVDIVGVNRLDRGRVIIHDQVIKSRKIKYLTTRYREYYKKCHIGKSIVSDAIVVSREAYLTLNPLDQRWCIPFRYPTDSIDDEHYVADLNMVRRRASLFDFLEEIGSSGDSRYDRIDEIFITPQEYAGIRKMLRARKLVFITGPLEYGKTYCAVRLMWEYYKRGYETIWYQGKEPSQREKVREILENIKAELRPKRIMYFEDPFGKTEYEPREILEREIGTILDTALQANDTYVIVTSRQEVYKEFEAKQLSAELSEFQVELSEQTPSYTYGKRCKALRAWAKSESSKWLKERRLAKFVMKELINSANLPTLLSIREFAHAACGVNTEEELGHLIDNWSKPAERAFAQEILSMSGDKKLFLSFPLIYDYFHPEFIRTVYREMVSKLSLSNALDFDDLLAWFRKDKIQIVEETLPEWLTGGRTQYVQFSHPSYSKTLGHLLSKKKRFTTSFTNIFNPFLAHLSYRDEAAFAIARTIAENFDALPENVKGLLPGLANRGQSAGDVAKVVARNFNSLPDDVRELLFKIAAKDQAIGDVAWAIAENFNNLPDNVRALLSELVDRDEVGLETAYALVESFNDLPENVRDQLLFKLADKEEAAEVIADYVAEYFDRLPENIRRLLFTLADKDETISGVAYALFSNFDHLPDSVGNELLLKLMDNDETASDAAWIMVKNYHRLPDSIRELLFKLANRDQTAEDVAKAFTKNFDSLPYTIRTKLWAQLMATKSAEIIRNTLHPSS